MKPEDAPVLQLFAIEPLPLENTNTMPTAKEHLFRILKRLPDDCTFEDIQKELYFIQLIEQRIESGEHGNVIPHEEVRRRVESWGSLPPSIQDGNP